MRWEAFASVMAEKFPAFGELPTGPAQSEKDQAIETARRILRAGAAAPSHHRVLAEQFLRALALTP